MLLDFLQYIMSATWTRFSTDIPFLSHYHYACCPVKSFFRIGDPLSKGILLYQSPWLGPLWLSQVHVNICLDVSIITCVKPVVNVESTESHHSYLTEYYLSHDQFHFNSSANTKGKHTIESTYLFFLVFISDELWEQVLFFSLEHGSFCRFGFVIKEGGIS